MVSTGLSHGLSQEPFYSPNFSMKHFRCFVADAHVWSFGIVKQYYAFYFFHALFNCRYLHFVEPFGLEYPVGTFGYRVS